MIKHRILKNHNWITDGVTGDIDVAIQTLIGDLEEGTKSYEEILYRWDNNRGNDWYTQTRKCLTEIDLDSEDYDED